jgi:hypothetical protein
MPYLDDGGTIVADSELILQHIDRKTDGGLYGHLTHEERADGFAFTRLAEEHLYWIMVASRWLDDAWFPHIKTGFFGAMPFPVRHIAPALARREVRQVRRPTVSTHRRVGWDTAERPDRDIAGRRRGASSHSRLGSPHHGKALRMRTRDRGLSQLTGSSA